MRIRRHCSGGLQLWTLVLLLGACGTTGQNGMDEAGVTAGVTLRVAPVPASPGADVSLILENEAAQAVGYNLCTSTLEHRTGDGWEAVPADRVCTMELRMLEPGQRADFRLQLQPELMAGTYRFSTRIEWMDAATGDVVSTDEFRVEPS
jgi:hypothetical protein